jgi:hypothetical protein
LGSITVDLGTFGFAASLPWTATLNSITVAVKYYLSSTFSITATAQALVSGSPVGTTHSLATSTSSSNISTATLDGVSWADLDADDLSVEFIVSSSSGSSTIKLDYIEVTVNYTDFQVSTGSATLSGDGTLTGSTKPAIKPAVALAGGGTLAVSATSHADIKATVALSGTGTLVGTITDVDTSATVALSGDGVLSTVVLLNPTVAVALGGGGTLSAGATSHADISAAAALSGSGTLTTTVKVALAGTATLAGTGTLATQVLAKMSAAVALSGAGTLTTIQIPKPAVRSGTH